MDLAGGSVETYINALYTPLGESLEILRAQAENEHVPIIQKSTEMLLCNVINMKKPKHILEIGTAVGYSAACFAEKDKNCRIISIESNEEMYEKALRNLGELKLSERVQVICGDAEAVIREKLASCKFDFVFIDAAKSHYKRFFNAAAAVCTDDAVIISDNMLLQGIVDISSVRRRNRTKVRNMKEYIQYISSLPYADTSILPVGDGLAITVLKRGRGHEEN